MESENKLEKFNKEENDKREQNTSVPKEKLRELSQSEKDHVVNLINSTQVNVEKESHTKLKYKIWISIDDSLPMDDFFGAGFLLAYVNRYGHEDKIYCKDLTQAHYEINELQQDKNNMLIHWMPIPTSPIIYNDIRSSKVMKIGIVQNREKKLNHWALYLDGKMITEKYRLGFIPEMKMNVDFEKSAEILVEGYPKWLLEIFLSEDGSFRAKAKGICTRLKHGKYIDEIDDNSEIRIPVVLLESFELEWHDKLDDSGHSVCEAFLFKGNEDHESKFIIEKQAEGDFRLVWWEKRKGGYWEENKHYYASGKDKELVKKEADRYMINIAYEEFRLLVD
jgi:hypothetical protein